MKRQRKMTRAQKEELSKINRVTKNIVDSIDYDRKGAIIDEAFRKMNEKKEEVQREKIKLPETVSEESEYTESVGLSNNEQYNQFIASEKDRHRNNYCSVYEFERTIFIVEGIQIIIRANTSCSIRTYIHKKGLSDSILVDDFIRRLGRELNGEYCFELPGYDGLEATTIGDLRKVQSTFINKEQLCIS